MRKYFITSGFWPRYAPVRTRLFRLSNTQIVALSTHHRLSQLFTLVRIAPLGKINGTYYCIEKISRKIPCWKKIREQTGCLP
jgi:hypothetical protein